MNLDLNDMLEELRPWVECESPTFDATAVNNMMTLVMEDLKKAGASVERIAGPDGFGDCLLASFPHPSQGQPGILFMGHLDTVHPVGTLEKLPFRRVGDRCYGPGILDMKSGVYAALRAIRYLAERNVTTALPIYFLLTCDEEIGSPGTRGLIERVASQHRCVLVPEPPSLYGVVTGRFAIARYHLTAYGRPSHAGAYLKDGHSAIREMAQRVPMIESMTDENCTFSIGVINGGKWVNCVSTECRAEVLSLAKRQEDLDEGARRLLDLTNMREDGTGFKVEKGVVRPVWTTGPETFVLLGKAEQAASEIGIELTHGYVGGGSDGNFTGAMRIPTLDGLGLSGAGEHTLGEYILVDSLLERTRLIAQLLPKIDGYPKS